ncbi:hypothetical protein FRB99_006725 [Tulasnella sp. 403]|nr:hypothetical protein FRB99_006725 [Tulasnella sp. 403]
MTDASNVPAWGRLDPALVEATLSKPPFYQIEGLLNVRSLPLPATSGTRGLLLRSAELTRITEQGKDQLRNLGITRIFDLRSPKEIQRFKVSVASIEGIEVVTIPALPIERDLDLNPFWKRFASGGDDGFVDLYGEVLEQGGPAFKAIFEHIRDRVPLGEGCLIHCTGGKDRTGVAAMLILDLVGVSDEYMAEDYSLTRIGMEPAVDLLGARFKGPLDDPEIAPAILNGFSSRWVFNIVKRVSSPQSAGCVSPSAMLATLAFIREKYGGAEGYLKEIGFLGEDIEKIKKALG